MTREVHEAIARITERYTARLHEGLRREFSGRSFQVEMAGAEYVSDEPLEVCVTFSRAP